MKERSHPQQKAAENRGPDLPFAFLPSAALQLHETGHSPLVQHFYAANDGRPDK
ncbi:MULTISPECIES: hypothetical protein [Cohaesibacter]|uniref:hypothetical protein n=1 Tax=Cohaesibacter TaxID=655352 RepID=UPI00130084EB|nr:MULTISPECIES: hypothetical protein [Cohaesibacter]